MVRVALIAGALGAVAACRGASQAPGTAPVAPAETPWDRGTFVIAEGDPAAATTEENFQITRTPAGYRIRVTWKRPSPTGEATDGQVTFETDEHFSPITGDDVMNRHAPSGTVVTKSSLRRDADGRLATEVLAADGTLETATSAGPNDWFIGGGLTTFLVALCQAGPDVRSPIVYPDKVTRLDAPKLLPVEARDVTYRVLEYVESKNQVIVACEDGKVVGEVTGGVVVVRRGDTALATALARLD